MSTAFDLATKSFPTQLQPGRRVSRRNQQLTRIIAHLRDQLRQHYPQLAMPTQWMIQQLVDNASIARDGIVSVAKNRRPTPSSPTDAIDNWRVEIMELLKIIHQSCDVGLDKTCTFVHTERLIPLFPNHELFDEWDAYRFSQTLLHYLENDCIPDTKPVEP